MVAYYDRKEFARLGLNQPGLDYLADIRDQLIALIARTGGSTTDLTAILARLDAVEALAALALQIAEEAPVWMRTPPTAAQILALADDALKVPNGDWFFTPSGDRLLMPA